MSDGPDREHCPGCGSDHCAGCGREREEPRFCTRCGRRLTVYTHPGYSTLRCRDHGEHVGSA